MKKFIAVLLCALFVVGLTQIPVCASDDTNKTIMHISRNAGAKGVHFYDASTGNEKYYPPELYCDGSAEPIPASPELQVEKTETAPYNIIGSDSRTPVRNPSGIYESTCLIGSRFIHSASGVSRVATGTGWLLNDSFVMTAGHMLYDSNYGFTDHCGIFIGSSDGKYKHYRLGHKYHVGEDYVSNCYTEDRYYYVGMYDDWGVIELVTPVSSSISKLGLYEVNSASDMEGRSYRTQGYPEDLNLAAGKTGWNLWTMYQTTGYIQRDRSRFLDLVETDIDVYKGQSGSPVYSYRMGYGYCVEGMIVATSTENEGEPRNFIILMNNFLAGFINNLP